MTVSDDLMVCAGVEGLLCLSDLADMTEQPLCSAEQPCLSFFPGMGFRPAAWTMQRDQYGDYAILVVSGDDVYLAKYAGPIDAFSFLPDTPVTPVMTAASVMPLLAVPTPGTAPVYGRNGGFTGFSGGGGGSGKPAAPDRSGSPSLPVKPGGGTSTDGGGEPDLPPLTPVPLSGSGLFLVLALVALMLRVGHRKLSAAMLA